MAAANAATLPTAAKSTPAATPATAATACSKPESEIDVE